MSDDKNDLEGKIANLQLGRDVAEYIRSGPGGPRYAVRPDDKRLAEDPRGEKQRWQLRLDWDVRDLLETLPMGSKAGVVNQAVREYFARQKAAEAHAEWDGDDSEWAVDDVDATNEEGT